jgi:hypothetical protein
MDEARAKGDYYKIVPPPGAHLWVSDQYAKYVGPVPEPKPPVLPPKPEPVVEPKPEPAVEPAAAESVQEPVKPAVVPEKPSSETKRLKECYALAKQIDAQLAKPIEQQDYNAIKKTLNVIINDPKAGKAKLYAEYQLDRLGRFELALRVNDEVKRQDAELKKLREQIKKRYQARLANIPDPGKFIADKKTLPGQACEYPRSRQVYRHRSA